MLGERTVGRGLACAEVLTWAMQEVQGQAMPGSLAWWAEGFAGRKGAMGLGVMLGLARPDNVGEAVGLLGN